MKLTENVKITMAFLSFGAGVSIASLCLFAVDPIGEIHNSAIGIVSEFLILAGACLGMDVYFDNKMSRYFAGKFKGEVKEENV